MASVSEQFQLFFLSGGVGGEIDDRQAAAAGVGDGVGGAAGHPAVVADEQPGVVD